MSDTIQIKAGEKGNRASMPALALRELAFCTDVDGGSLFIGTASGNKCLGSANRMEGPVFPGAVSTMAALEANATLEQTVTAFNTLLATLKAGGLMQS